MEEGNGETVWSSNNSSCSIRVGRQTWGLWHCFLFSGPQVRFFCLVFGKKIGLSSVWQVSASDVTLVAWSEALQEEGDRRRRWKRKNLSSCFVLTTKFVWYQVENLNQQMFQKFNSEMLLPLCKVSFVKNISRQYWQSICLPSLRRTPSRVSSSKLQGAKIYLFIGCYPPFYNRGWNHIFQEVCATFTWFLQDDGRDGAFTCWCSQDRSVGKRAIAVKSEMHNCDIMTQEEHSIQDCVVSKCFKELCRILLKICQSWFPVATSQRRKLKPSSPCKQCE